MVKARQFDLRRGLLELASSGAASAACTVLALLICGGCAPTEQPLPDVARSTRAGVLTHAQQREFCEWQENLAGGPEITCADGNAVSFSVDSCLEGFSFIPPECPLTLGERIECRRSTIDACFDGEPPEELPPPCRAEAECCLYWEEPCGCVPPC